MIYTLDRIISILFFAGVDRSSFERIEPEVVQKNRIIVEVFAGISAGILNIFFITSFFFNATEHNRLIYGLGTVISIITSLVARFPAKRHDIITKALVHATATTYYVYAIIIGAIIYPQDKAVTMMVLLVFLPMLFINRPFHALLFNIVFVSVFIFVCLQTKTGRTLSSDIVNALTFSAIGTVSGSIISNMKIRGYINEHKLHEISRVDQLTQMNNRNAYEIDYNTIPLHAKRLLACIYIDVNGLHTANNTKGHSYGDEMLKYISEQIIAFFGKELSYRIGGDEFIIFVPEPNEWVITQKISEIRKLVESRDYHIAVGINFDTPNRIDMDYFINQAEVAMYHDKDKYYESIDQLEEHNQQTRR